MAWIIVISILLYLIIGSFFMQDMDDYDGGGKGSYIICLIWPFIVILWLFVTVFVIIPDGIVKWFKYRRDK